MSKHMIIGSQWISIIGSINQIYIFIRISK